MYVIPVTSFWNPSFVFPVSSGTFGVFSVFSFGPTWHKTTGNKTTPWNKPNITVKKKILKIVMNTCVWEPANTITERNVVSPPFVTAGPILRRLFFARSSLVPIDRN